MYSTVVASKVRRQPVNNNGIPMAESRELRDDDLGASLSTFTRPVAGRQAFPASVASETRRSSVLARLGKCLLFVWPPPAPLPTSSRVVRVGVRISCLTVHRFVDSHAGNSGFCS